jgi:hypothetical protein
VCSSTYRTKFEPMKPAPPVTRSFVMRVILWRAEGLWRAA